MSDFAWRPFLEAFSREMLADADIAGRLPADVRASGWLGFDGASEPQLAATEARLGRALPASYRTFLATTNGWRKVGAFIDRVWSTDEIEWFRVRNQEWIDAYAVPFPEAGPLTDEASAVDGDDQDPVDFHVAHLQTALEISDTGDSAILLLNPEVVTSEGEWEAWFFADWLPGANRYRSFQDLMEAERRRFGELRSHDQRPRSRPPGLFSILLREIRSSWRASRAGDRR